MLDQKGRGSHLPPLLDPGWTYETNPDPPLVYHGFPMFCTEQTALLDLRKLAQIGDNDCSVHFAEVTRNCE